MKNKIIYRLSGAFETVLSVNYLLQKLKEGAISLYLIYDIIDQKNICKGSLHEISEKTGIEINRLIWSAHQNVKIVNGRFKVIKIKKETSS